MKKNTLLHGVLIVLFTLLLNASARSQESFYKVTLSDQIDTSTFIAEGKVLSSHSFWDNSGLNIYTAHMIEIFKVFKGLPQSKIQIITRGGVVGLEAEVVSNSLRLRKDDLGVFILSESNIDTDSYNQSVNSYKSVSANQGFYRYILHSDRALNTFEIYNGIDTELYRTITKNTGSPIIEIRPFNISDKVRERTDMNTGFNSESIITSISATEYSAGTRSVLTISGNNFGNTQGSIGFSDTNYGGAILTNALDSQIISWTNTQIEVEIPGHAGTGDVCVNTIENGSITSMNELTIDFAQINLEFDSGSGSKAYQTQHIDNNTLGGDTWHMNLDFYNSSAKISFDNAFQTWTCQSGVNWIISSNTTTNSVIADDNQNLITFNNLASGLLGQCISRYSGCFYNGELRWYVDETDIVFNSNINWNFSSNTPVSGEIDFETVAIHELGHGLQLGHVIDNDLIMHYSLSGGVAQRQLSPEDLMGAQDIVSRSTSSSICSQTIMTNSSCFNSSLSANDFNLSEAVYMYPNPATDIVSIRTQSAIGIINMAIYNVEGKQLYALKNNTNAIINFSVNTIPSGIYFIHLTTDVGFINKKLIIK